jgi:suppressor for copper-sensitivity B
MSTIPFIVSKDFKSLDAYYERSWEKFDQTKLDNLIKSNEVVFVTVTADWCMTCQINKLLVIDRISTIELMKKHNVHPMIADITKDNPEISDFLSKNGVSGIPFNIVYGPKNMKGIVLPVLFTYKDLENAILQVI